MVADYTRVVSSNDYKAPRFIAVSVDPSVEEITVREYLLSKPTTVTLCAVLRTRNYLLCLGALLNFSDRL